MAELYPDHCIGIHLNMIIAWPPADKDPLENTSQEEQKLMANYEKYKEVDGIITDKPKLLFETLKNH